MVTSASPRAIETALAMGFAVELPSGYVPDADYGLWGSPLGHCDGARLGFDEGRVVSVQLYRAPAEPTRDRRRRDSERAGLEGNG